MKKHSTIYIIAICGCLLLAGIVYAIYQFGSNIGFKPEDIILAQQSSPDGYTIATATMRGMGATTAETTIVTLHHKGEKVTADTGRVFVVVEEQKIVLKWQDDHHLQVRYTRGKIPLQETQWQDVQILYTPIDSVQ